ncbi:MAG TPA: alpha/beta hydrolase-fold protein [Solirubrobacteraceae bacterium]|nr:alpha/beta hydrolase-fold protein [Solirubrobacteraceae bacterium]
MTLREAQEPLGQPWQRPLKGSFEQLVVESEALAGNPLGDPVRRPLYVYSSPGVAAGRATDVACVYILQGFSGQLDAWLARKSFEPTTVERIDATFAEAGCPEAVVVFVDAWTSLGGSQFLNSSATGNYTDYLCDEIVPFIDARYPTAGTRDRRAVTGHSSGGYGALVLPMLRPDTFGALVAHSPDTLFEASYLGDFAKVVRVLRESYDGSYEALITDATYSDTFDWDRWGEAINTYAMAAAYSPDPQRPGNVLLPFDTHSGKLIDDVWRRWLDHDPVRMAPRHADELASLRHIHVEVGRSDEYMLDVGTVAFSRELDALGIAHTLELFSGGHGGNSHRYGPAIRQLLLAI